MSRKIVCVIGAGAAGLCAGRHLSVHPGLQPLILEQEEVVGGTWVFTDRTGVDPRTGSPIHSSMYKNLRANLPKDVMAFPDYPFNESYDPDSYLTHEEVLRYLQEYSDYHNLQDYIKFRVKVNKVTKTDSSKWKIATKNWSTGLEETFLADAVMICNGHYTVPVHGLIKNIEKFKGIALHSHEYRYPDMFENKNVAILGAAASGADIGLEISSKAQKVFLCHNSKHKSPLPMNITQVSGLETCSGSWSFTTNKGEIITNIDALVYCTGYLYRFPFMSKNECGLEVDDINRRVKPLYKHFINITHPSICLIGIPIQICPFPLFDVQIKFFIKTLTGQINLPSKNDMIESVEKELKDKIEAGMKEKHFHKFGDYQWTYIKELENEGSLSALDPRIQALYEKSRKCRSNNLLTYKKMKHEFSKI